MSRGDLKRVGEFATDALDLGLNLSSYGAIGYDSESNDFRPGLTMRGTEDVIDTLTNRDALEEMTRVQREAYERESSMMEQLRLDDLARREQQAVTASNTAQALRQNARVSNTRSSADGSRAIGSASVTPQRDILGL